jgi:polyhydroxyalkanoate synthesis regulator protein
LQMSRQDQNQRVAEGGEAYQAGRDVVIHNGMSTEQMTEIMVSMARQFSIFQADAMRTVDERLGSFREEVLKTFAEPNRANPEAFRDPDFQYLLNEAQEAYARSGDDVVRDTLVDIIARRSLETGRTRMAMALNDAATRLPC